MASPALLAALERLLSGEQEKPQDDWMDAGARTHPTVGVHNQKVAQAMPDKPFPNVDKEMVADGWRYSSDGRDMNPAALDGVFGPRPKGDVAGAQHFRAEMERMPRLARGELDSADPSTQQQAREVVAKQAVDDEGKQSLIDQILARFLKP